MKLEPVEIEDFYDEVKKFTKLGRVSKINTKLETKWRGINSFIQEVKLKLENENNIPRH